MSFLRGFYAFSTLLYVPFGVGFLGIYALFGLGFMAFSVSYGNYALFGLGFMAFSVSYGIYAPFGFYGLFGFLRNLRPFTVWVLWPFRFPTEFTLFTVADLRFFLEFTHFTLPGLSGPTVFMAFWPSGVGFTLDLWPFGFCGGSG